MRIALINGSPKNDDSASGVILQGLKEYLPADHEVIEFQFRAQDKGCGNGAELLSCDALVFAMPLYVDGIPSHMIKVLLELEDKKAGCPLVYAIFNCGFHEGHQNAAALEMMRSWCGHAGLRWGMGLGVGAGGMLSGLAGVPMGRGPKKNLGNALEKLARTITQRETAEPVFITANFPRFAYRAAAQFGWRIQVRQNGLKTKDLFRRHEK